MTDDEAPTEAQPEKGRRVKFPCSGYCNKKTTHIKVYNRKSKHYTYYCTVCDAATNVN